MFKLSMALIVISFIILVPPSLLCCSKVQIPVQLTEKDTCRMVEITAGDVLEISLKGNPTTGYAWEVDTLDHAVLKQVGKIEFKADRKARGAGGKFTLRFEATSPGKTLLRLIYHRSFEKNMPPVKTYEVTVLVKE